MSKFYFKICIKALQPDKHQNGKQEMIRGKFEARKSTQGLLPR